MSSLATDPGHALPALRFTGSASSAQQRLEAIVRAFPRTIIVHSEPGYFTAESRSLIFRFVDDLAFAVDEPAGLIHFRSASRTGYSDFGVNRKRMQTITAAFDSGRH